jgi:class III poly(R)-hydroxyalkanoic acid synthase PhaE subunit
MTAAKSTQQDNDWFSSPQKYWDAWFEAQRKAMSEQWQAPSSSAFQGPWADFFKEWQNAVSGSPQNRNTDAFQQYFTKTGETFLDMMEKFYQATGQAKPLDQMVQEWIDQLQTFYANALQASSQPFDVSEEHKSFAHSINKASQVWASMLQPEGPPGKTGAKKDVCHAFEHIGCLTSMPGLGYNRKKQEQLNDLYKLWCEYHCKSRAYNAGMAKMGIKAVKKFQAYLANPPQDHEPLTSLRGIYEKWVDACEEVYAEYAMSEEYTRLYGEAVNALMAFKKQQNKMADDMLEELNMPTRREVDSMHERQHDLRRDNLQLRKDIAKLQAALRAKTAARPKTPVKAKKPLKKGKKS